MSRTSSLRAVQGSSSSTSLDDNRNGCIGRRKMQRLVEIWKRPFQNRIREMGIAICASCCALCFPETTLRIRRHQGIRPGCLGNDSKDAIGTGTSKHSRLSYLMRCLINQRNLEIPNLTHLRETLRLPDLPYELRVLLTIVAPIGFGLAITQLRYVNRRDRYQDHILGGGILITVVLGRLSDDFLMTTMAVSPWAIIFALLFSSLVHRIFGLQIQEEGSDGRYVDRKEPVELPGHEDRKEAHRDIA